MNQITHITITRQPIPESHRLSQIESLFGLHFPLALEPTIYGFADRLSDGYQGGYWEFYTLSNGGFYMAPHSDTPFPVCCDNGFEGELSADAFGIVCCLYAYSHLSFSSKPALAELCAEQFHWLRDFALGHRASALILAAID